MRCCNRRRVCDCYGCERGRRTGTSGGHCDPRRTLIERLIQIWKGR